MNFDYLIHTIQDTHLYLQAAASKAINMPMTIRNWLIGYYIVEFEQRGEDRAKYGDNLLIELAEASNIQGLSSTNLKIFRQFYRLYPEIGQTVSDFFKGNQFQIRQTLSDELTPAIYEAVSKLPAVASGAKRFGLTPDKLLKSLSFSHFVELVKINNDLKRAFYEIECAKGVWSVRELKRQVESLYFERSGLSKDKKKLSALVQQQAVQLTPADIINTPFAVEFLGLDSRAMVTETDLEQALIEIYAGAA